MVHCAAADQVHDGGSLVHLRPGAGRGRCAAGDPQSNQFGEPLATGGVHIVIAGGPTVSIQVNSSSPTAVACNGGNGHSLDTSTAGPSGTGGRLSIVGGPTLNPYCGALTTLNDPQNLLWISGAGSVANPYVSVPTPSQPIAPQFLTSTPIGDTTGCIQNAVSSGSNGCARKDPTYGFTQGIWVGPGTDSCPAMMPPPRSSTTWVWILGLPITAFTGVASNSARGITRMAST